MDAQLVIEATVPAHAVENEADYVGLYMMARAGYDVDQAQVFLRRLVAAYPNAEPAGWANTHPSDAERAVAVRLAAEEIKCKQALGALLVPETKLDPDTPTWLKRLDWFSQRPARPGAAGAVAAAGEAPATAGPCGQTSAR
jgi:hypothetical protein